VSAFREAVSGSKDAYPSRVRFFPVDPDALDSKLGEFVFEALFEDDLTAVLVRPDGHEIRLRRTHRSSLVRFLEHRIGVVRIRVEYSPPPRDSDREFRQYASPRGINKLALTSVAA
jgi:hypothetical protein